MKLNLATGAIPLLDVRGVSASYGGMLVLQDVSLHIYPAEVVALVVSNGAGETTLLRALSRMLPCRGSMTMNSRDLFPMTSDRTFAAGLVQVPEGRQLFDRMSVHDNLLMGAFIRDDTATIVRDLNRMYTRFPRLAERRHRLAGSLSGGEQQLCAMVCGMRTQFVSGRKEGRLTCELRLNRESDIPWPSKTRLMNLDRCNGTVKPPTCTQKLRRFSATSLMQSAMKRSPASSGRSTRYIRS